MILPKSQEKSAISGRRLKELKERNCNVFRIEQFYGLHLLSNAKSRSICAENPTGEKGKGGASVTVMSHAGEGGAWGIALLAMFTFLGGKDLEAFLNDLFKSAEATTIMASEEERASFQAFMEQYRKGLSVEALAGKVLL